MPSAGARQGPFAGLTGLELRIDPAHHMVSRPELIPECPATFRKRHEEGTFCLVGVPFDLEPPGVGLRKVVLDNRKLHHPARLL